MSTTGQSAGADVETLLPLHLAMALRLWEVLRDPCNDTDRQRLYGQIQGLGQLGEELGLTGLRERVCAAYAGMFPGAPAALSRAEALLARLDAWAASPQDGLPSDEDAAQAATE